MTKEIVLRRLSIIKHLHKLGDQQSQLPETIAYSSVLSFHDSIDLFNQLAAEYQGKTDSDKKIVTGSKRTNLFMMEYFDLIPILDLKPSVKKINDRRNSLKHNGQIPAKIDIDESRVIANLFFEQNTPRIFGIDYNEVSLVQLISNQKVKDFLSESEKHLLQGETIKCVKEVAKAFWELQQQHSKYWNRHRAKFGDERLILPIPSWDGTNFFVNYQHVGWIEKGDLQISSGVAGLIHIINRNFGSLFSSLDAFTFGVDFGELSYFRMFMPVVVGTIIATGEYAVSEVRDGVTINEDKCRFAIDFVIKFALNYKEPQEISES